MRLPGFILSLADLWQFRTVAGSSKVLAMVAQDLTPLVSCIMPTYNRRAFVPHAIRYFLRQEYANKELIIIDDGSDCIADLVPDLPEIRYYRLDRKRTLGEKLNLACRYASGAIIANWDDDDWYAPRRLRYQVEALRQNQAQVCGINRLLYYDVKAGEAYEYAYPKEEPVWLLGSSLCYTRTLWDRNHFANINVGMDGLFVWATPPPHVLALPDHTIAVHMIHPHNVCPKKTSDAWWSKYPAAGIQQLMQDDWRLYHEPVREQLYETAKQIAAPPALRKPVKQEQTLFYCLVHENESTVIDLVRNLHYYEPGATILLYNGGHDRQLLRSDFPYERYNAHIHPAPAPARHGYLHGAALDAMAYALQHLQFTNFTIVDSDQLALRKDYSAFIGRRLQQQPGIGLLSSMPHRVTTAHTSDTFWPAKQALREFELWRPLLRRFPGGEASFVHWTFWPSTVFTRPAVEDLVRLFREDAQLQSIMRKTQIWATEEVIFPTLLKMMGYEIGQNPCNYSFVQYQKHFTQGDLQTALHQPDAFWMHPVERRYDHPLRQQLRIYADQYHRRQQQQTNINHAPMLTTFSLLDRLQTIEGWLHDKEADLLISTAMKACSELPAPQHILEIGSYHGKSTVLLGSIVKEYFADAIVTAIDPHQGNVGAADQGVQQLTPSLAMFNKNIAAAGITRQVQLIQDYSTNVVWDKPIALLFIDGLHDYVNVAKDFWHFEKQVSTGAYIAFHDYADYYPGVVAFVDELVVTGEFESVGKAESLVVLKKL